MKKIIFYGLLTICIGFAAMLFLSPYQYQEDYNKKVVVAKVKINKPVETVFKYLGNSNNAQDWSVYVDHITTLNPNKIPDGKKGSIRRCFQFENEKEGDIWDEEVLEIIPNQKRTLSIFNMKNFRVTSDNIITEQVYHKLGEGKCELSFTVYLKDDAPLMEKLSMSLFAYKIKSIFKRNISNVKRYCEQS